MLASLAYLLAPAAAMVVTPKLRAAVIVPGFLNAASDYEPLALALTDRGLPSVVVPMPIWHWIPTIGGRSVRPVLDRIDSAVRHVAAMGAAAEAHTADDTLAVPAVEYSLADLVGDFRENPGGVMSVGGSTWPDDYPLVEPRGSYAPASEPAGSVAIIGCSAGGYMARVYLASRPYGGKAYGGQELVHTLVTLGTPHLAGQGVPFENVRWANGEPLAAHVRALAVGATGTPNEEALAGAYAFCDPSGNGGEGLDGDGVTTSDSAVALPGAETKLLPGVTHYPWSAAPLADVIAPSLTRAFRGGKPWYGSEAALDGWVPWLLEPWKEQPLPEPAAAAEAAAALVVQCATRRGVPAPRVLRALDKLAARRVGAAATAELFRGPSGAAAEWDLVFSSAVAELPLVGGLLGGYLPNRETLRWDLEARALELEIELLPFAPAVRLEGRELRWDAEAQALTYRVNERPPSTWTLLFADAEAGVIAARSSVTGLAIIRRREAA